MNLGSYTMPLAVLSGLMALTVGASAQGTVPGVEQQIRGPLPEAVRIHRPGIATPAAEPSFSVSPIPTQQYSHGDPTAEEQYVLEMINRARANPVAEGDRLAGTKDPFILNNYKFFKVDTAKVRADFAGYPSRPPLAFNAKLIAAARRHSNDMAAKDFQGHEGSDHSTFDQRINQAGYTGWTYAGENVSAYASTLFASHAGFNVDWGNEPTIGHRHNIMNFSPDDAIYTEIGVGVVRDDNTTTKVGPWIVTHDFGNKPGPFLVGVVYNDANGNNFYDVGEGIPGVKIMPSTGTYYAVTSASGGYAIPMSGVSGPVTLTASGGGLAGAMTQQAAISGQNVKADFIVAPKALPEQVTLISPLPHVVIFGGTVQLSWNASTPNITGYRVQVGRDSLMTMIVKQDSTVTGRTLQLDNLVPDSQEPYYWRVQAKNSAGWGPYSESWDFFFVNTPLPVSLISPEEGATVASDGVEFTWTGQGSEVTAYWFEIATDQALVHPVISDSTLTQPMKVVNGLEAGETYYWRVRARNSAGWSVPVIGRMFQVALSGVETEPAAGLLSLGNAPNPFSGSTAITFSLPRPSRVTLTVRNSLGEEVATLLSGDLAADIYTIPWNAAGVADGVYYYTLRADNHVETRAMVLTR